MPKKIPTPEGAVLHSFRRSKGLTELELAKAAGVTPQTIRNWESGRQIPSRSRLEEVLDTIGVPPEAIAEALLAHRLGNAPEEPGSFAVPSGKEARLIHQAAAAAGGAAAEAVRSRLIREWRQRLAQNHRRWAEELWTKMKKLPPQKQEMVVEVLLDERSWALAERVCQASIAAASHKADEALRLARLAVRIAERLPGPETRRLHMRGYCADFEANALRVAGNHQLAEEGFLRADELWLKSRSSDLNELLDGYRRLDLKASLLIHRDRPLEALVLLNQALERASSQALQGRLLLLKARALEYTGEYHRALEVLRQAEALIDVRQEPRNYRVIIFNRVVVLCHLEQFEEARHELLQVEALVADGNLDQVRLRWLQGRVWLGLRQREKALAALSEVRQYFHTERIDYDFAVVSMEIAVLYLDQNRVGLVKKLAEEMLWIFQRQRVHKQALAALALFCQAASRQEVEVQWAERLVKYLYRAQHAPGLRFEP